MSKQSRRESREAAFAILFAWSFQPDEPMEEFIIRAESAGEARPDEFARDLCSRTAAHVEELDKLIETYSDRWKIGRISKVNLAVLRLAFCELSLFSDIPAGATINEAVELVKTFGTEDEAAYVNGILGTYERSRHNA
jgi:N utilization substance protein B